MSLARSIAIAVVFAAGACSSLERKSLGVCGNGVLEGPEEDCDSIVDSSLGPDLRCGSPDDAGRACAYVCVEATCPDGWACGADGVCVHPAGFEPAAGYPFELVSSFSRLADVDGDGAADLVSANPLIASLSVRYGTGAGGFADQVEFGAEMVGEPTVVDLDGDGRSEIVAPVLGGLLVLPGQASRALAPRVYSTFSLGESTPEDRFELRLLPLRARAGHPGSGFLILLSDGETLGTWVLDFAQFDQEASPVFGSFDGTTLADIAGRVPIANVDLDPSRAEEDFALPIRGASRLGLFSPRCIDLECSGVARETRALVALPGATAEGALFTDFDGDGRLDLLVAVGDGMDRRSHVAVALGDGAGGFRAPGGAASTAEIEPAFDALLSATSEVSARWPLAAGDIDGDGVADYVSAHGVHLNIGGELFRSAARGARFPWSEAVIADLNRDGHADVAAVSEGVTGVELLLGDGTGFFSRGRVDTVAPPSLLRSGDFDGDLVKDLTFRLGLPDAPQSVAVLYGAISGEPLPPITMGELAFVESMEPATLFRGLFDITEDLIVESWGGPGRTGRQLVSLLSGSRQRRLSSPYPLEPPDGLHVVIGGRFDPARRGQSADLSRDLLVLDDGRWWLIGHRGGLSLADAVEVDRSLCPDLPRPSCLARHVVDLDGDGATDELVLTEDERSCAIGPGRSPRAFSVSLQAGPAASCAVAELDRGGFGAAAGSLVTDLDRDGRLDLVVAFGAAGPSTTGGVRIGWDVAAPGQVTTASIGVSIQAVARVADDRDAAPELALFADRGIWLADLDGRGLAIRSTASLEAPAANLGQLDTVDLDRDGLEDLVVTNGAEVRGFLARRHRRGGAR